MIFQALQLNPKYQSPTNYRAPRYEHIMWMPVDEHPEVNFIGAILGPRGNNQKRLEKETGCKISVRGKGAEKSNHRGMLFSS